MHHNSQKRITPASSSGASMTSLSHSRAKNILQHHFRSSTCVHNAVDSAEWGGGGPQSTQSLSLSIFNLCLLLSLPVPAVPQFCCISAISPSSSIRHICTKDYLTIYIQQDHQWRWGLLDEFLLSTLWFAKEQTHIHKRCFCTAKVAFFFLTHAFLKGAKAKYAKQKTKCKAGVAIWTSIWRKNKQNRKKNGAFDYTHS